MSTVFLQLIFFKEIPNWAAYRFISNQQTPCFYKFVAMLKKLVSLLAAILPFTLHSQDIVQVNFTETAYDERYHKGKLIVPIFRYTSPEIEEYEKFGAPGKKALDKFTLKKLPDMTGCVDTAYGFIYYTGVPSNTNRGYITLLIGNYRRSWDKIAQLYVDRNNNLDFTDDGPAISIPFFTEYLDVEFANPAAEGAVYKVRLSRFPMDKDAKYRQLMDEFYQRNQGNKVFAGIDYSFKENRMNMKGTTYINGTDTFRIGLYDGNYDGLYTNAEFDLIYVAKQGDSIFLDDYRFVFQDGMKEAEFEWNFKVYKVTELDPAGRFMKFYWDKNAQSRKALRIGKKIPKFEFYLTDAKTVKKIKKYRKKGLYVYFYSLENPNIEEDTAVLRQLHNKYSNCLNIVTLNYGDYYKTLNAIKVLDAVPYTMGISNRRLNRMFNIEQLPTGFLCRKRLRLSHIGVTPKDVWELMEKGSKKD
jgi:hypothetical protein